MAEGVLFDTANSLLHQISSLLKDEFLLLWTSKRELEKLHKTIATIKGVLLDAERKQPTAEAVRVLLARLQDEMYKADDLFDEISTKALQKEAMSGNKISKEVRLFFSKSNHLALLVSTAHKVKERRRHLDAIASDIRDFGFITIETEAPRPILSRQEEHSYINMDDIIGRDEEKESILNILKADAGDGAHVSVIAIVGFGGSGKTALAQLVYNELKPIEGHFDLYLWACVNYFSELNVVLEKLIACLTEDKCKDFQLEQLQKKLREMITGKKYLLVLDDVWEENLGNWLRLKCLLDVGNIGSKILVTTRSEVVAETLSAIKPYRHLEGLLDEDAWSLFKKFAFYPKDLEKIQRMEKIGKDIVKRCGNVPLAIRTMGSFLRDKDERRWLNVLTNEFSEANIGVMEVLKVSYDDLPSSLKHSFAYCSLFPEDHVFEKDELIRLWMAQGFLEFSGNGRSLEEVGEENFYSLLQRCFFQEVQKNDEGDIFACKMHDLLHDLAINVAGRDCCMMKNFPEGFNKTHLHVSYYCEANFSEEIPPLLRMEGLKTLLFGEGDIVKGAFFVHWVFRWKSLRVLDLSRLVMEELPSSIGKLVHLRYLDLSWSKALKELPSSICKLQNLLTLKLHGCKSLKKLPIDLKLLCLRHLEIYGCDRLCGMPSGLQQMTSLVTLDMFVVDNTSGGLRYLRDLNNLRGCLHIKIPGIGWRNAVADAKQSMLMSKTELTKLEMEWRDAEDAEKMYNRDEVLDHLQPSYNIRHLSLVKFPGTRISSWIFSLENLKTLCIDGCTRCHQLPPLQQLHHLEKLVLWGIPLVEYMENDICYDTESFFPSLVKLRIWDMPRLKGWWKQTTHTVGVNPQSSTTGGTIAVEQSQPYASILWFPRLSSLEVFNCPEVTDLPLFPYIERLSLVNVNEKLLRQSVLRAPNSCINVANSSITPFSCAHQTWCRLEYLSIVCVEDLITLPHEWAEHLSTLRELRILRCPKLKSLDCHMLQCLTSLEELNISDCKEFIMMNDDETVEENELILKRLKRMRVTRPIKGLHHLTALEELAFTAYESNAEAMTTPWIPPPNLKHLTIEGARELHHFSEVFNQLSKQLFSLKFFSCDADLSGIPWEALVGLRILKLEEMSRMEGIPERCKYLPALQELEIVDCSELEYLPDWITRLRKLQIAGCPLIKEKYKKPSGPCYFHIQHVPHVDIY